jgi:hypothetical protein
MKFSERIKKAVYTAVKSSNELTIKRFADFVGITDPTLYGYFKEHTSLENYTRQLLKIASASNKPLVFFLEDLLKEYNVALLEDGSYNNVVNESATIYEIGKQSVPDCERHLELKVQEIQYLKIVQGKNEIIITDKAEIISLQRKILDIQSRT